MKKYDPDFECFDEVNHSRNLIFSMRYGPCIKSNGTVFANLGDHFELGDL